ncbi:MAG: RrF2 family transcriptional regulator [Acidimicrobiia bacterium]
MQVALGRKGDYSVRAVLDLARVADGDRRKAREIATDMDIPQPYVTQILADLVRAKILTALAGPDGGYALAKPPAELSLLEVVEAAEGPILLERCVLRGGPCGWTDVCPIHVAWTRAQGAMIDELRSTTFAELSAADEAIDLGTFEPPAEAPPHATPTERAGPRQKRHSQE